MQNIRQARPQDAERIAEIYVFNYRLNFYPIFLDDSFYFKELTVNRQSALFESASKDIWVFDDGAVKGFIQIDGREVKKLFVEPVLQGNSIGAKLMEFAIEEKRVNFLWALEKNTRAIEFYRRYGFAVCEEKKYEEDTTEFLVRLNR